MKPTAPSKCVQRICHDTLPWLISVSLDVIDFTMAEFYRQFAFVSSVLAGFSFAFYGTLLISARQHRAGTWAAFLAVAASVAFLPVTVGMTFAAARATNQPSDVSISNAAADPQLVLHSMLFLFGMVLLFASFGVSGWMRSRGLGIATTSLSLIGAIATFASLKPFLHVMSTN